MAEITPMMKQYLEIKEQNKDSILFFRLGDFYEMFNEDAQLASRELDLTLTTRDRGKAAEDQTPMCGIPYHSSDAYIARLIAKGYKVAICEQTEDPALAKGLVKRDIIRVITPGTVIDSACLDDRRGNFLCGIFLDGQNAGAAFCDMTTGHTHVTAFSGDERAEHLYNELSRFSPAEAVLSAGAYDNGELVEYLRDKLSCAVERGENRFELKACEKAIRAQFGEEHFASLPRNNPAASLALGALLSYLHETQKTDLSYIKDLEYYEQGRFMEHDLSARRNLELTETIRAKEKRGSLLWVLDKTKTAMGARNLRAWLTRPLRDVAAIERRLGAVEALTKNTVAREELILSLSGISDMERLIGRIVYGTAGGRDLVSLRNSIEHLAAVREQQMIFHFALRPHAVQPVFQDLFFVVTASVHRRLLLRSFNTLRPRRQEHYHVVCPVETAVKALPFHIIVVSGNQHDDRLRDGSKEIINLFQFPQKRLALKQISRNQQKVRLFPTGQADDPPEALPDCLPALLAPGKSRIRLHAEMHVRNMNKPHRRIPLSGFIFSITTIRTSGAPNPH